MAFQPGNTYGTGRPKGAGNRLNAKLRQSITDFLSDNFEAVQDTWNKANERDRLQFYVQLLRFALPQLQNIELQSDLDRLTDEQLTELYENLKAEMLANLNRDER